MRPIKVLVGMPFARALGGAERLLRTLAVRVDVDVHVVCFEPGPLAEDLGAEVFELGRFRDLRRGGRVVRDLRACVRHERPDLLLAWLPRAHPYLVAAAQSVPVAWWQHHNGEGEQALTRAVTAMPAAGIVCTSQAVAEIQAEVRPPRTLHVCHPGVESPTPPSAATVKLLRKKLGLQDRFVAVLPGRLVAWKGQERFLHALALLRARGDEVAGVIVGGGSDVGDAAGQLRRLAADLRVPCVITGHVDDPTPYMALGDAVVNASENEPFGMTLPEAMSLGVPVMAVASGGPLEIVQHDVSGLLVADGSPQALADGLGRLQSDAALRSRLAAAGRTRYAERFTAEAFGRRASSVLRSIADAAS